MGFVGMGRPKKEDAGKALRKMEDAFWEMLKEMPYNKISVQALSKRANVNHNTFYYYFADIDDLAKSAIEHTLFPEIPAIIHHCLEQGDFSCIFESLDEGILTRFERLQLAACSDSLMLVEMQQKLLVRPWLDYLGVDEKELTQEERLELSFCMHGLFGNFRKFSCQVDKEVVVNVMNRPLYKAIMKNILNIKTKAR